MQSPVSRNAPCPCGSGKRFKECHGLLASPGEGTDAAGDELRQTLDAALAAQMAERFPEAISLYRKVAAAQPGNFDALHMLGVVHYQRGDLEQGLTQLRAALKQRPFDSAARRNLELIEAALQRRTVEKVICREVLPRLARRCVVPDSTERWQTDLDVIILKADMDSCWQDLARLLRWLTSRAITVWTESELQPQPGLALRRIDLTAGEVPRTGQNVFFGADHSPGEWFASAQTTERIGLYCSDEAHCLLLDRIPELIRAGRVPVRLLFSSAEHARRIG
ncbi:MAG: tetratricopeptide repeat protein, partial [Casimicrobiaceae bacterium]